MGELRALTAEDFDFEKNILSITKSYQKIKGKDVITKPKTKRVFARFICQNRWRGKWKISYMESMVTAK